MGMFFGTTPHGHLRRLIESIFVLHYLRALAAEILMFIPGPSQNPEPNRQFDATREKPSLPTADLN